MSFSIATLVPPGRLPILFCSFLALEAGAVYKSECTINTFLHTTIVFARIYLYYSVRLEIFQEKEENKLLISTHFSDKL